jgi:mevalonate kinase
MEININSMFLSRAKRSVGGNSYDDSGHFYSRGKFLITGEYAILHGAGGLALPVSRGQDLKWKDPGESQSLDWTTRVKGRKVFSAAFRGENYFPVVSGDRKMAVFLRKVLVRAAKMSVNGPVFGKVISNLDFDMEWGLGSSSSLISNIAYLFDVNPFALHFAVSRGSGYDIACARSDSPILYRLDYQSENYPGIPFSGKKDFRVPVYREVEFRPPFRGNLYFAWTGKKQDSAGSVERFLSSNRPGAADLEDISQITADIVKTDSIGDFNRLLAEHDRILSRLLDQEPISDAMFRDFPGYVKSLGAWGGDFIMISWEGGYTELQHRLKNKGIEVVFPYDRLIYFPHGS